MYEVNCSRCGQISAHPSRVGAESIAERHAEEEGHDVGVDPL